VGGRVYGALVIVREDGLTPTQRRARKAKARLLELIQRLAPDGCCAQCGLHFGVGALEVSYTDGAPFKPNQLGRWDRVARYWRDYEAGVEMRALCSSDNRRVGAAHPRSL